MDKRLIPYSVHLPEHIYHKIKEFAGSRQAAGVIRDAITSFCEGSTLYDKGFNSGLDALAKRIDNNKVANSLAFNGETMAALIAREIATLRK